MFTFVLFTLLVLKCRSALGTCVSVSRLPERLRTPDLLGGLKTGVVALPSKDPPGRQDSSLQLTFWFINKKFRFLSLRAVIRRIRALQVQMTFM